MKSVAVMLVTPLLLTAVVRAQQAPSSSMPSLEGLTAAERKLAEDLLPIPKLDPKATVASLEMTAPLRFVLDAIAAASGVRLSFDAAVTQETLNQSATVKLSNVAAEDALGAALKAHLLAFKATYPKAALIYADTPEGRAKYVELIRTFPVTHADVASLTMLLNKALVTGVPGSLEKPRPILIPNKEARVIYVRTNAWGMAEVARMIAENDK